MLLSKMDELHYPPLTENGPTFNEMWDTWRISNSPSVYALLLLERWGNLSEESSMPSSKELLCLWQAFSSPTTFGKAVLMRWGHFNRDILSQEKVVSLS